MEPMSEQQLEKLAKNPHYKMSQKQMAWLEQYRAKKFKNNPNFVKHPTDLKEHNARERKDDGKEPDSNQVPF